MSKHPTVFATATVADGRRILGDVQRVFRGVRETERKTRETFLDTFDWRLYDDGRVLCLVDGSSGMQLVLQSLDGELLHRCRVDAIPRFVGDIPAGPLRDLVSGSTKVRCLLPVAHLDTRRTTVCLDDESVARLVLEHGTVRDPEQAGKSGRLPAILQMIPVRGCGTRGEDLARYLEDERGLLPVEPCRLTRALRATGRRPGGRSSRFRLRLSPSEPAPRATARVFRKLFDTMRLVEDGVRADLDTEFLHDFRVSIRRTRSALGQLRTVLPVTERKRFGAEFSAIGRATNALRDLDVYLLNMPQYRALLPAGDAKELGTLERFLERRRAAELQRVVKTLDARRYKVLLRDWERFLDELATDSREGAPPVPTILDIASERIRAAHQRVLRRGRKIGADSPAVRLHRLRIDCKKLRYLLEFFAGLFDEATVKSLVKKLKRLQDNLGRFNDLDVQQHTLEHLSGELAEAGLTTASSRRALGQLVATLGRFQKEERGRFDDCFARFDSPRVAGPFQRLIGHDGGSEP